MHHADRATHIEEKTQVSTQQILFRHYKASITLRTPLPAFSSSSTRPPAGIEHSDYNMVPNLTKLLSSSCSTSPIAGGTTNSFTFCRPVGTTFYATLCCINFIYKPQMRNGPLYTISDFAYGLTTYQYDRSTPTEFSTAPTSVTTSLSLQKKNAGSSDLTDGMSSNGSLDRSTAQFWSSVTRHLRHAPTKHILLCTATIVYIQINPIHCRRLKITSG